MPLCPKCHIDKHKLIRNEGKLYLYNFQNMKYPNSKEVFLEEQPIISKYCLLEVLNIDQEREIHKDTLEGQFITWTLKLTQKALDVKVKKVIKLYNEGFLTIFNEKIKSMIKKHPMKPIQQLMKPLFFGTGAHDPKQAFANQLDLQYRADNGYGLAYNFYSTLSAADGHAYKDFSSTYKHLLFGFVLVGDSIQQQPQQLQQPPAKENGQLFDSVTGA